MPSVLMLADEREKELLNYKQHGVSLQTHPKRELYQHTPINNWPQRRFRTRDLQRIK